MPRREDDDAVVEAALMDLAHTGPDGVRAVLVIRSRLAETPEQQSLQLLRDSLREHTESMRDMARGVPVAIDGFRADFHRTIQRGAIVVAGVCVVSMVLLASALGGINVSMTPDSLSTQTRDQP